MKVRTEAKRVAIVQAAIGLFRELGYERASMSELVKRLGGSKATLYGYFPSKEALFSAVVRASATTHLSEATADLRLAGESQESLESTLLRFAEGMLRVLTNDANALAVYRMVIAEAGRSEVGQLFYDSGPSESIQALASLLEAAMARGELRKSPSFVAALQFTALVTAETDLRLFQRDPAPLELSVIREMAGRAVDMFFNGAAIR